MTTLRPAVCSYPPCRHNIDTHDVYPHGERRRCLVDGCDCRYPWANAKPPMVYVSNEFRTHMKTKR